MPGLTNTGLTTQWIEEDKVIVGKISPVTGTYNKLEMKFTRHQFNNWWQKGQLIQNAMPHLTSDEREFLISGCLNDDEYQIFCGIK